MHFCYINHLLNSCLPEPINIHICGSAAVLWKGVFPSVFTKYALQYFVHKMDHLSCVAYGRLPRERGRDTVYVTAFCPSSDSVLSRLTKNVAGFSLSA